MGYTIITHFDSNGYYKLHSILSIIEDVRACRVPYGRVDDKYRYQVDTLPYHIRSLLSNGFTSFTLTVMSLGLYEVWPGKLLSEFHFAEHS